MARPSSTPSFNGQADLLPGYVMDQSMKIKDATGKDVYPIKVRRLRHHMARLASSPTPTTSRPNATRQRFMSRLQGHRSAEKGAEGRRAAILDANPKGGRSIR